MEWEINLKECPALRQGKEYEDIYTVCLSAYAEGRSEEKKKALEAYRLRCDSLFGNKCMSASAPAGAHHRVCDGDCFYIRKFRSELEKLDG